MLLLASILAKWRTPVSLRALPTLLLTNWAGSLKASLDFCSRHPFGLLPVICQTQQVVNMPTLNIQSAMRLHSLILCAASNIHRQQTTGSSNMLPDRLLYKQTVASTICDCNYNIEY